MPVNLNAESAVKNSPSELKSLINGHESDLELQELIVKLVLKCPPDQPHSDCPFRILAGLSYASMTSIVKTLPRESCLSLFDMERNCRIARAEECAGNVRI